MSQPVAPSSLRSSWSAASRVEQAVLGCLVVTLLAASWYLVPFWRESAELSHGFFAPVCALALLWQSRREPDYSARVPRRALQVGEWTVVLLGILLAAITALAALAQGPFHSQTGFLAGSIVLLLTVSSVLVLARSPGQLVRLNGASLAAALLWCFVVPLPSGTLARFTLLLQDIITAGSVHAVHLLGQPAIRDGNIIKLTNALVGVEEACSGIRSLTACLFAGIVLGGLMLNGIWRRVAVVLGAAVIAFLSNFIRSITLCLLAAYGIEIKGFWHDTTGFAVLGVTAAVLFAGCLVLSPKSPTADIVTSPGGARTFPYGRTLLAGHAVLAGFVGLLVVLVVLKTRPSPASERPAPDLQALITMGIPGWDRRTDESIFAFGKALNTSHLRQETYRRDDIQLTFYVAFWPTHQSTLGSVALHTPEICLPGAGWNVRPLPAPLPDYPLRGPQRFAFDKNGYPQYVWFWHYFDGRPVLDLPGLYPWQLGPMLMKPSVSASAPQWVVRVSSNKPLESLLGEPILREFFSRLRAAGLAGTGPTT